MAVGSNGTGGLPAPRQHAAGAWSRFLAFSGFGEAEHRERFPPSGSAAQSVGQTTLVVGPDGRQSQELSATERSPSHAVTGYEQRRRAVGAYFDERFESEFAESATKDAMAAFDATGRSSAFDARAGRSAASDGELLQTVRSTAADYGVRGVRHPGWRDTLTAKRTEECAETPGLLAARANQQLDADRWRTFDKHLASCRICHAAGLASERAERAFAAVGAGDLALESRGKRPPEAARTTLGAAAPSDRAATVAKAGAVGAAASTRNVAKAGAFGAAATLPARVPVTPRPAPAGRAGSWASAAAIGSRGRWLGAAAVLGVALILAAVLLLSGSGSKAPQPTVRANASHSTLAPTAASLKHASHPAKRTPPRRRTASKPAKKRAQPAAAPASSGAVASPPVASARAASPPVASPPVTPAPVSRPPVPAAPAPSPPPPSYTPPPTQAPAPVSPPPPSNPQPQGPVAIQQHPGLSQQPAPTQGIGSGR